MSGPEPSVPPSGRSTAPTWLLVAAVGVAVQGVTVAVLFAAYGLSVRDEGHGVSAWVASALGIAIGGVLVAVLARALRRASPRAVAPTVLTELIVLGEAYNLLQEHRVGYAAIAAASAAVALTATLAGFRALARAAGS